MTSRRNFFKIVLGGITFSLAAKDINLSPVESKTIAPATTSLGRELSRNLVSPGWHRVKITDILIKESKKDGSPYFVFDMQTKDGSIIHYGVSPKTPHHIFNMINKTGTKVKIVHDSFELDELIGKELDVEVKIETFNNRNYNRVEV